MSEKKQKTGETPRRSAARAAGAQGQKAQEMLRAAACAAVQMLVRAVEDEEATLPQRMDAAKTILDRVYGKASQPAASGADTTLQIVMADEVRELME